MADPEPATAIVTSSSSPTTTITTTAANTANTATTTSTTTTADAGFKTVKDKNCPFCGQAFTSSSLGRHLDLYIRPKNPKAPDGIHRVDEIRKLRGGITRRHAKGSISIPRRGNSNTSTPAATKHSAASAGPMLVDSPDPAGEDGDDHDDYDDDEGKPRQAFRDIGWQSARTAAKTSSVRRDSARQLQKAHLAQRRRSSEDDEIATATELALKELLRSVREASARASGSCLFDFDPYSLTFPALCLRVLPAPSTLFSPTPFPTPDAWSIAPPTQQQYEALNKHVRERLLAHQRQRQISQAYPSGSPYNASSAANSPLPTPPLFDPDPQKLFCHIADAYNHWTRQTEQTRQEYWQIEVLRCYALAAEQKRETELQLENARREIEYLKATYRTSGASDLSPISIHLGRDTASELGKHGIDYRNWDYERLIEKWRLTIRERKASVAGMAAQKPLPTTQPGTRSCSMASVSQQPFSAVRDGPFTAPPTVNGDNGDQVDAEGDDDDDDNVHLTPHTLSEENPMDRTQPQMQPQPTHQQHLQLHMPQQATPLCPPQQMPPRIPAPLNVTQAMAHVQHAHAHAQAQAQVQAQAQAQAQAWAAARQHMNQSRSQNFSPHQHQQLSPHMQQMNSAENSRRASLAMMDPNAISPNNANGMGMSTGLEGMDNQQDQFLRMDMGMSSGFVASHDGGGVSMGS